ncbi:transposase [Cytophagaceae bacterium BD1B2-1]|uniref:Transposase n=1 Tax=Xanthocytophaga agilis TaxID=3048010 RepID=A0AAE3RBH5_9BACT|nr:transposase [Xanthocytophaga agilis]MDJ1505182.1 transposase [Xanthocytophaga agilis]
MNQIRFTGFKLHLVINAYGQIVNYSFTTGNVVDNNGQLLQKLLKGLEGFCVGDKGYHTRLFDYFYSQGLQLLVKPKNKSIPKAISLLDHQLYLKKRALIESVNELLISICNVEHTHHRKVENAFISMMASLIAYQSLDHEPCIFVANTQHPYAMAA